MEGHYQDGMGIASVTHHVTISVATARTSFAWSDTLNGFTASMKRKKTTPASNEIRSRRLLIRPDNKTVEYLF